MIYTRDYLLSVWVGHVHEHAPQRISALFVKRKSVNDRGSPSGCCVRPAIDPLSRRRSPPRRNSLDGTRTELRDARGIISTDQEERRRASQARLTMSATRRWSRVVAQDVAAGAAAAAGTIVGFILKGRDTHGRHDAAADCRCTSSYEKLAPQIGRAHV